MSVENFLEAKASAQARHQVALAEAQRVYRETVAQIEAGHKRFHNAYRQQHELVKSDLDYDLTVIYEQLAIPVMDGGSVWAATSLPREETSAATGASVPTVGATGTISGIGDAGGSRWRRMGARIRSLTIWANPGMKPVISELWSQLGGVGR